MNKLYIFSFQYLCIFYLTLTTELGNYDQEYLFKDKNNEYWKMNIAGVQFKKFISVSLDNTLAQNKEYCDLVIEKLSTLDLQKFFSNKIEKGCYFNKCELEYIARHYPNMYDMAKDSREKYVAKNKKLDEEILKARKQEQKETVKQVNTEFKKQLKELKKQIYSNGAIQVFNFRFYKDDKYENGITEQNCVLYLAKQYGINIPLATQGFINNRLTAYHFAKQITYFKETSNKRCSQALGEYLHQIQKKVKEEYKKQKKYER